MLVNTPNQSSKFKTKHWVDINVDLDGVYCTCNQIKSKTSMLRLSLCDYSDACILAKGTTTVPNMAAACAGPNNRNTKCNI